PSSPLRCAASQPPPSTGGGTPCGPCPSPTGNSFTCGRGGTRPVFTLEATAAVALAGDEAAADGVGVAVRTTTPPSMGWQAARSARAAANADLISEQSGRGSGIVRFATLFSVPPPYGGWVYVR